jgi:hypothetical protein
MEKQFAQMVLERLTQDFSGLEALVYDRRTGRVLASRIFVNPVEKACRLYLLGERFAELGRNLLDPRATSLMISGGALAVWIYALTEDEWLGVLLKNPAEFAEVDAWVRNCINHING